MPPSSRRISTKVTHPHHLQHQFSHHLVLYGAENGTKSLHLLCFSIWHIIAKFWCCLLGPTSLLIVVSTDVLHLRCFRAHIEKLRSILHSWWCHKTKNFLTLGQKPYGWIKVFQSVRNKFLERRFQSKLLNLDFQTSILGLKQWV